MYKYYNAHPTGVHTGDCVKRAITAASGIDYKTVQRELNQYKKPQAQIPSTATTIRTGTWKTC